MPSFWHHLGCSDTSLEQVAWQPSLVVSRHISCSLSSATPCALDLLLSSCQPFCQPFSVTPFALGRLLSSYQLFSVTPCALDLRLSSCQPFCQPFSATPCALGRLLSSRQPFCQPFSSTPCASDLLLFSHQLSFWILSALMLQSSCNSQQPHPSLERVLGG